MAYAFQPAPYGGMNFAAPYAAIEPHDAVWLRNWWPTERYVGPRAPITSHFDLSAKTDGGVRSLLTRDDTFGAPDMICVTTNGDMFKVGNSTEKATGLNSPHWHGAVMDGVLGLCSEGADAPKTWDGSTLAAMTISGSGLTPSDLDSVHIFKSRSYFWDSATTEVWYSAVNTLGGACTKLALGNVGDTTGTLTAINTMTLDGGEGPDDYIMFLFSDGVFLVYQGSNPGDAADWSLVGRYQLGRPAGIESSCRVGSDVLVVTDYGVQSTISAMRSGDLTAGFEGLGQRVHQLIRSSLISAEGLNEYRAYIDYAPAEHMLAIVMPTLIEEETPDSSRNWTVLACNTKTGAWSHFLHSNASHRFRTVAYAGGQLFFGGDGSAALSGVYVYGDASKTQDEAADTTVGDYTLRAKLAWFRLPEAGPRTQFQAIRFLGTNTKNGSENVMGVDPTVYVRFDFDSNTSGETGRQTVTSFTGDLKFNEWYPAQGFGSTVSVWVDCKQDVAAPFAGPASQMAMWHGVEYVYTPGGLM